VTREVVLVSRDATSRSDLATYLAGAGFAVHELDEPPSHDSARSLVWLTERDVEPCGAVETWLANGEERSAVIVTWRRPTLLALVKRFADRLVVLAPPVFGYQLVDALRGQFAT
jgi:hypothetical protein